MELILNLSRGKFEKALELAVTLDFPYPFRSKNPLSGKGEPKIIPAAVLILIGYSRNNLSSNPSLLYIRRTESVETHKGQMAFPGGICEPTDEEGPVSTALRETEEEVGITREEVQSLGHLPSLVTTTAFSISPVVGIMRKPLEEVTLKLDSTEIEEALWIPLQKLLDPGTYRKEEYRVGSSRFFTDVYQVNQHRIWGATGAITKNLLDRLNASIREL